MTGRTVLADVALVVIGRNEGQRLKHCLASVVGRVADVVYVDSGSTDGSMALASSLGARAVPLDRSEPFTAARARNVGASHVLAANPDIKYLQFVDGDCELAADWLDQAREFLQTRDEVVAVCGRRRERFPDRSVYNLLCDLEWDTPVGEAPAFGGDVMIRARAFQAVGGYRTDLIAGEDPELAVRLRRTQGAVWRVGAEMTLHDAAMTRFGQWWRRTVRAGYAYSIGASVHGKDSEPSWVRASRRAWLWGFAMPVGLVVAAVSGHGLIAVGIALLFPLQVLRITLMSAGPLKQRATYAFFLVLGKFAEAVGQIKFVWNRWSGRQARLIEYK